MPVEGSLSPDMLLEYCIKMIMSNQLNEQDIDSGISSEESSFEDSSIVSDASDANKDKDQDG